MKKGKILLIIGLIALLIAAAAALIFFGCWLPYHKAASSFTDDRQIVLYTQPDGAVQITWPQGKDTDQYLLEIIDPVTETVEYSVNISGKTEHILYDLTKNARRCIRISTVKEYKFPLEKKARQRLGLDAIEIEDVFSVPCIQNVGWLPDEKLDQLTVTLNVEDGCTARVYEVPENAAAVLLQTVSDGQAVLAFGDDKLKPLPTHGEQYTFALDVFRQGKGYVYYSEMGHFFTMVRQDLLDTDLHLECQTQEGNRYQLSWNETKGDIYLLQHRTSEQEQWESLAEIPANAERAYTTEPLQPYTRHLYRVIACTEHRLDEEPIAQSEETQVQTASTAVYATIWPLSNLTVYGDCQKNQSLGTAAKGKALCVLAEENGMFRVRFADGYGYIDSNYCMINLPDYMGDLCSYDITNSYRSLYKIHDYDIPKVTGNVIVGYEKIRISRDHYLVPLLYPTAKKLEKAALAAQEAGYVIKIYDAFRPQQATHMLYDTASAFSKKETPKEAVPENWNKPDEEAKPYTYALYMTDSGRYSLNYFLAYGRSRHNLGIAMDMTLVKDGKELQMQTAIHDLSWYSESGRNNEKARTLSRIMKSAGFGGLVSEWWHFQDNEAQEQLNLEALWSGVTPEGWMTDGKGWRYRCADGSYYTNRTKTIEGKSYRFDSEGYAEDDIPSEETGV